MCNITSKNLSIRFSCPTVWWAAGRLGGRSVRRLEDEEEWCDVRRFVIASCCEYSVLQTIMNVNEFPRSSPVPVLEPHSSLFSSLQRILPPRSSHGPPNRRIIELDGIIF